MVVSVDVGNVNSGGTGKPAKRDLKVFVVGTAFTAPVLLSLEPVAPVACHH